MTDALASSTNAESRVRLNQPLLRPTDFKRNAGAIMMQASATFLAATTGTFKIHYSVNPASLLTVPSLGRAFCNSCYYDILVEVRDDCGNLIADTVAAPFPINDFMCYDLAPPVRNSLSVPVGKIGEYTVMYILRLSNEVINVQTDFYIQNNGDLKTIQHFFEDELQKIDLNGCYSDCMSCETKLGSQEVFAADIYALLEKLREEKYAAYPQLNLQSPGIQGWITTTYGNLLQNCRAAAATCVRPSPCDQFLQMMKADVMPGGQYALFNYDSAANTYTYVDRNVNVLRFYNLNQGDNTELYNFSYTDENNNTIFIRNLSESDFIRAYTQHPEWADMFVKKHIEYCSYLWCKDHNEASYAFDQALRDDILTGEQASSRGFFNRSNYRALLNADPFFAAGGRGAAYVSQMEQDLLNLSAVLKITPLDGSQNPLPGKNILQLVDWMLYCNPGENSPPHVHQDSWLNCNVDPSCRSLTREWEMYRNYYLKMKSRYVRLAKLAYNPDCTDCFIGQDVVAQGGCLTPNMGDFMIRDEAIGRDGMRFFFVYKEGSLPIPDNYILQYSVNIRGNITYHSATAAKGEPRLVLFEYTNTPAGIPTVTLLSVTCRNTSNTIVAGCNPTSGGGEVGPCPASWEFSTVVRRFRKIQHEPCPVFEWDEYVVHSGGPVTRRVHVKVLHYTLIRPEPYEWIATFEPGDEEYLLGTFHQSNGGPEGCWDEDHNFSISEEPPVCEEVITYPPSTCRDDARYELYVNKSRVFNDFIAEDGYASCIVGDGAIPQTDTLYAGVRQQELVNLEALRSNWQDRLRAVVTEENELDRQRGVTPRFLAFEDLYNGTTVNPKVVQLVDNLYLVAKKSIEVARKENIRAASTLPPGVVADNGYDSFESVFRAFAGDAIMQQGFNQYLLEKPYPYNKSTIAANPTGGELNATVCANMATLRNRYSASGFGGSFHEYLKQELEDDYVFTAQELSDMETRCNRGCRYLDKPVLFPVAFVTPFPNNADHPVADCNRVHDLKMQFEAAHPGLQGDSTKLYRVLLGNYLNHRLGYALSYADYAVFLTEKCPSQGGNAVIYNKAESPLIPTDDFACVANLVRPVYDRAADEYERYIAIERRLFRNRYISKCLSTGADARLEGDQYEYHHTLYYYDQSGDLVKTIPPEGVHMLDGDELKKVELLRHTDPSSCDGSGLPTFENKAATFDAFSTALQTGEASSVELWLYNNTVPARQIRFITQDNNYLFQTAISDNKLWVELYLINGGNHTLLNRAVADISATVLLSWSHLVIQSADFGSVPWDLYLDGRKLTLLPPANAPPYPFPSGQTDELADLKHFRLYGRQMLESEITEGFRNSCFLPAPTLGGAGFPMLVWGRFNIPSPCSYTGETNVIPNRGSAQMTGNLDQNTRFFGNVANTFTVELWVQPFEFHEIDEESQYSITGVSNQRYVIYPYWGGYSHENTAGMGISVGTNGVSVYEHADGYMPPLLVWPGSVSGWTHVAVVYQDRTPSLYINGQFVRTGLSSTKQTVVPSYNFCSGPYGVMMGNMDEIRIWNTARTPEQIQANYRQGLLPATSPGLVGYWPVSPEDGTILRDISCSHADIPLAAGTYTWLTAGASITDQVIVESAKRFIVPLHGMPTRYQYNSQHQVVRQTTPDAGVSEFWYDRLGRMAVSQNAEQKSPIGGGNPDRYSYTKYDALGRITEAGEKILATGPITEENVRNEGFLSTFHGSGSNQQVTVTAYDEAPSWAPPGLVLRNLRKRVVASATLHAGSDPAVNRFAATYYSYDITGNVEALTQENADLARLEKENVAATDGLKVIRYEYDLINGKANKVLYQDGKWDQFYYYYLYDADNRVIKALSSRINYADLDLWVTEATYRYYLHGPLARVELGKNKVQGVDYAYTLQGWLKGVNGQAPVGPGFRDMAHDGFDDPGYYFKHVARDVYNFSLGYYNNDYRPVNSGATAFGMRYEHPVPLAPGQPQITDTGRELFNGNISHGTLMLRPFDPSVIGYSYSYDQLHRLTGMRKHAIGIGTTWNNASITSTYQENYSYDGNGNIKSVLRNGSGLGGAPVEMDALQYVYETDANQRLLTNKLRHVTDATASTNYADDIDTQDVPNLPNENYQYDAIGNMISDRQEKIKSISWNVYGKINQVYKEDLTNNGTFLSGTTTTIGFRYDPSGRRISKSVVTQVYAQGTLPPPVIKNTFYVRDAQGNVLGVYTWGQGTGEPPVGGNGLVWNEQHLYGNTRLGIMNTVVAMPGGSQATDTYSPTNDPAANGSEGKRTYELSNHLGNVIAVVNDRHLGVDENEDGITDYYNAELVSANDYYPYGWTMPGRRYNGGGYRYGFNGKENDNDLKGTGNAIAFDSRIYDPRIGRWLSTDPVVKPWLSSYQYASDNPVNLADPDGSDEIHFHYMTVRTNQFYTARRSDGTLYVDQRTVYKTFRWVEITKDNNKDRFFVHRHHIGKSEDIEFYPNVAYPMKSGVTSTDWFFGAVTTKDTDYEALMKITDDFPELQDQVLPTIVESAESAKQWSVQKENRKFWNNFYQHKYNKRKSEQEQRDVNEMMLGIILSVVPVESILAKAILPRASQIFVPGITGRALAEEYALGTTYKGYTNANKLITNNVTFDLFNLEKRHIVDVTTVEGKTLFSSDIKNKLMRLSDYSSEFFTNRTLQIYHKHRGYSKEQINQLRQKIEEFLQDNQITNVRFEIGAIK
jgi:RHS repeat-associated protein